MTPWRKRSLRWVFKGWKHLAETQKQFLAGRTGARQEGQGPPTGGGGGGMVLWVKPVTPLAAGNLQSLWGQRSRVCWGQC